MTRNSGLAPRDHELIAAFIDRRMSAEERRGFMERLDREEALYEVFVETVRFRDQESGRPAEVVEHPASRRRWLAPAAVAALLAVAAGTVVLWRVRQEQGYAEALVADERLGPALGEDWLQPRWPVMRGSGPSPLERKAALRLGARAVDLEVALRLGRRDDAGAVSGWIAGDLDGLDLPEILRPYYEQIGRRLAAGEPAGALLDLARQADAGFAAGYPELESHYRLGQWAEAGWLAVRGRNRGFLASAPYAGGLRELGGQSWEPEVEERLETARALLGVPPDRFDMAALEATFKAILEIG